MTRHFMIFGAGSGDVIAEGRRRQRMNYKIVMANKAKVHHKRECRCETPGCGTILSRYHAGKYCFLHEPREYKSIGRVNYHDLGKYGRGDG